MNSYLKRLRESERQAEEAADEIAFRHNQMECNIYPPLNNLLTQSEALCLTHEMENGLCLH